MARVMILMTDLEDDEIQVETFYLDANLDDGAATAAEALAEEIELAIYSGDFEAADSVAEDE
jgi:hypothetical protein